MIITRIGTIFVSVLVGSLLFAESVFAYANDPHVYQEAYKLIGVYDAWKVGTGSRDVVVAVIDNGFDHFHPDLIKNVWKNIDEIPNNGIDDDNNGYIDDMVGWNFVPEDINNNGIIDEVEELGNNNPRPTLEASDGIVSGHGTAVAGLIGATGYNNYLGTGINWRVSLMNIKIVGNSGSGTIAYVPDAIRYAVDNGADVISMSIVGTLSDTEAMKNVIAYAHAKDVVVVAAAGNTTRDLNKNPIYPVCSDTDADQEEVLGVSAVTLSRAFAAFSNYGDDCIDITAPGVMISSTVRYGNVGNKKLTEQYRGGLQGTSFATPLVAGTAALIRSTYPRLSAKQVMEAILTSTSKTPTDDEVLYANLFGAGLLQVDAALDVAKDLARQGEVAVTLSEASKRYQLGPQITVEIDDTKWSYYVGGLRVRDLQANSTKQIITLNTQKTVAYVLSEFNTKAAGYTIDVYHTGGVKLRDINVSTSEPVDGIFMKGSELYLYRRSSEGATTYRVTEGQLVPDVTMQLPEVKAVTYDSVLDQYIVQQYTRTLTAWNPDEGSVKSQFIPASYGGEQFIIALGGTVVTQFDEVGVVWDGNLDSIQIFSYITE